MKNHEHTTRPNSNESSEWDDVAALANQYPKSNAHHAETASSQPDKTTYHINLGHHPNHNRPINTRPEETFQIPGQYIKEAQPLTPHEVLEKQHRNETISHQAAINAIESQIKLNEFQTASLKSQIDAFKTSHSFLKRRFGKSAAEFQHLQHQLHSLEKQRTELNQELADVHKPHTPVSESAT